MSSLEKWFKLRKRVYSRHSRCARRNVTSWAGASCIQAFHTFGWDTHMKGNDDHARSTMSEALNYDSELYGETTHTFDPLRFNRVRDAIASNSSLCLISPSSLYSDLEGMLDMFIPLLGK